MKTLGEYGKVTEADIVRMWLTDRGLVACSRRLMEPLAALDGNKAEVQVVYYPALDRYGLGRDDTFASGGT